MAYKILGQEAPTADTDTTLYTVPQSNEAVTSSLMVCNTGSVAAQIRVAVRPGGAALATKHYQYYDVDVPARTTFKVTAGWTLAATDVVTIRSTLANVAFTLHGREAAA